MFFRDDKNWFGQNLTSRNFGIFPRNVVTIRTNRASHNLLLNTINPNARAINGIRPLVLMDSQNFISKNLQPDISFPIEGLLTRI